MQTKKKKIMFMSRRAQITISFLLIFFILFSIFSIALFASREMWASAKFKGAVDAASLSAGADMAKGASLFIKVTAVRLVLFAISTFLYILSIPFPMLLGTAQSVGSFSKNISKALGKFSDYIPLIYTIKAEVDAYTTFMNNFTVNDQNSSNDFGIVVIPTYSIEKSINLFKGEPVDFTIFPMPSNLNDSIEMLRKGVTVFGYRKYTYLEQIKNNLNISNNYPNLDKNISSDLANWINTHDFIISSSTIGKTDIATNGGGVDLSDAVKISNFIDVWDSGASEIEKEAEKQENKTQINNIINSILGQASNVVSTVDDYSSRIYYKDGESCNYSYSNTAVCSAKNILNYIEQLKNTPNIDIDCLNDLTKKVNEWNNFCKQTSASEGLKGVTAGNDFAYNVGDMRGSALFFDNNLQSAIKNYKDALAALQSNGQTTTIPETTSLVDIINEIKGYTEVSINTLQGQLNKLPNTTETCYQTITKVDAEGNITYVKVPYTISLASTKSPMSTVLSNLKKISNSCQTALNTISNLSKNFDQIVKDEVNKSTKSLGESDAFSKIADAASAFTGLPGGNFLAYIVNPSNYNCSNCANCDPPSIYSWCNTLGTVGKFACAVAEDINLANDLLKGDLELTSYYSARLDIPDWIGTSAKFIPPEYKNLDSILTGFLEGVKISLSANLNEDKGDYLKAAAASVTGSIISGVLSGGISVIMGLIITTVVEVVIKPLLSELIVNSLFPYLEAQATQWINDLRNSQGIDGTIVNVIENSLSKFVDIFNALSTSKLRLIGNNLQTDKICNNFGIFLSFLISRAAPETKIANLTCESKYAFV